MFYKKAIPLAFFLILFVQLFNFSISGSPQLLGSFHVNQPGYINVINSQNGTSHDLLISCFNGIPFTADHLYRVTDVRTQLGSLSRIHLDLITTKVTWPNEVNEIPHDVFGHSMVSVAGGFLVPFKSKGTITLFNTTGSTVEGPYEITGSHTDHEWFYHRVRWIDMNGDGAKDAVTCRGKKSTFGGSSGQLVWYEHPRLFRNNFLYPWTAHVIGNNSDTFFDTTSLPSSDGLLSCIITTGYFSNELKIYWTTDPKALWNDPTMIHSRIIESSIGHVFDVQVADLNDDGNVDLLVTANGISQTGLYIYEVPSDFRTGTFIRHVLKSDFHSHNILPGGGAPGSAQIIRNTTNSTGKPMILLSGDDDSRAYLFSPQSALTSDWSYQMDIFLDTHTGTIGGMAYSDVDDDGFPEIFVPAYSHNLIYVYTLKQ